MNRAKLRLAVVCFCDFCAFRALLLRWVLLSVNCFLLLVLGVVGCFYFFGLICAISMVLFCTPVVCCSRVVVWSVFALVFER